MKALLHFPIAKMQKQLEIKISDECSKNKIDDSTGPIWVDAGRHSESTYEVTTAHSINIYEGIFYV